MTGRKDASSNGLPSERPTLVGSKPVRAAMLAWMLVILAFVAGSLGAASWQTALFAAGIVSGAFYFGREAVQEVVRERVIGIELLMTVAIAGAAALGQWREAALVAALYSKSEALEGFTIQRTRHAIRGLMDLVPRKARVLREGVEIEVDVKDVGTGEQILIRPGENIPVDGIIRDGSSTIYESAVTGESMPVERRAGQPVFAGTLNGNGAIVVETARSFADNTVSKIIDLVEQAQAQKGRTQVWVERFGRIYSPTVLVVSLLLAVVRAVVGMDALTWLRRAVAFLVAASPCALAVATPVTLVAAIGSAARRGVLIKGGSVLELPGRVRAVALDKTGTIRRGKPEVVDVHAIGLPESDTLRLAAAVEHYSEHPLAPAIVRHAEARTIQRPAAIAFRAITSAGVTAVVEGQQMAVRSHPRQGPKAWSWSPLRRRGCALHASARSASPFRAILVFTGAPPSRVAASPASRVITPVVPATRVGPRRVRKRVVAAGSRSIRWTPRRWIWSAAWGTLTSTMAGASSRPMASTIALPRTSPTRRPSTDPSIQSNASSHRRQGTSRAAAGPRPVRSCRSSRRHPRGARSLTPRALARSRHGAPPRPHRRPC